MRRLSMWCAAAAIAIAVASVWFSASPKEWKLIVVLDGAPPLFLTTTEQACRASVDQIAKAPTNLITVQTDNPAIQIGKRRVLSVACVVGKEEVFVVGHIFEKSEGI